MRIALGQGLFAARIFEEGYGGEPSAVAEMGVFWPRK